MGGVLFQYGTAVHLAILTVAPLFLSAFCGPSAHAAALFWMSLLAATWVVANPSPRRGEWPRDARHRIGWELWHDPFLTYSIVALVLSAVAAVNGGIGMDYDPSSSRWFLKEPYVSLLPGSVSGAGFLPLVGLFGLSVVTLGVRHALGSSSRICYLLASSVLSAAAVVFWWWMSSRGGRIPRLVPQPTDPFPLGSLLGVYFLFSLAVWIESWSLKSALLELSSALSGGALLTGLVLYAPTHSRCLFALLGALAVAFGVVLMAFRRPIVAWGRTVLALALALSPVAFLITGCGMRPSFWPLFPEGFLALREAASAVAVEAWRSASQLGCGLGSYSLTQSFFATPEHWKVLTDWQTAVPNGWLLFLLERGMLGVAVFLAGVAILLRDGILRYLRAGSAWTLSILHLLGPAVLLVAVALLFVECSYTQLEELMPVGAALALTAATFPASSEAHHG